MEKEYSKSQQTIAQMFSKGSGSGQIQKSNSQNGREKKYVLCRQLVVLCALDFEAFNISERKGFRQFCEWNGINPLNFPTPTNIADTGLNDVYCFSRDCVQIMLKESPKVISLVMDCWTDNFKRRSFVNYRVHYSINFKMCVVTLKTEIFHHPHTALRLKENIEMTLKEFQLVNKTIVAVTDNGANIVAGLREANIKRIGCINHSLHLFLTADIFKNKRLSALSVIVTKMKTIYKALMYKTDELSKIKEMQENSKFLELLKSASLVDQENDIEEQTTPQFDIDSDIQDESDLEQFSFTPFKSLKNSNATRWGSTLNMLESFVENIDVINIGLGYAQRMELFIGDNEKCIMIGSKNFLNIFKTATIALQGQKYPTLNLVVMFYEQIMKM